MSEELIQEPSRRAGLRIDLGKLARLLLTILILVASIMLVSGTIATSTTSSVNPGGTFTAGALILSNSVEGRAPCLSSDSTVSCDNLFPGVHQPGRTVSTRVTIKNDGTIAPDTFTLYSSFCQVSDAPSPYHGAGDLCQVTTLTIHDDVHNFCYYPSNSAGPCAASASGTFADFVRSHPAGSPLKLATDHLGSGETFTITADILPAGGNEYQGRTANIDFTWHITQG
jgi:hypothetical protein